MKRSKGVATGLLVMVMIAGMALAGYAGPKPRPGEVFPCPAEGKLDKTVAPEALLETFSCVFKKWEGKDTLHFNVTVKNVSDQPQRFRVNIFLDNGKAVGGLIPRTTKKGLVQPGQSASFVYPVTDMAEPPGDVMLRVTTLSQ